MNNLITTTNLIKSRILLMIFNKMRVFFTLRKNDLPRFRLTLGQRLRSIDRAVCTWAQVIMARTRYGRKLAVCFRGLCGQILLQLVLIAPFLKQGISFADLISFDAVRVGSILGMIFIHDFLRLNLRWNIGDIQFYWFWTLC